MTNSTLYVATGLSLIVAAVVGTQYIVAPDDPRVGHGHDNTAAYYTCPMHPSVKLYNADAPCPICGMDLTPVPQGGRDGSNDAEKASFVTLTDDQKQLIGVKTSEVVERETSSQIRTSGRICYDETAWVDVNLKVSGWIQDLYVDHVGRPVRKGEALFTLYSPDLVSGQEEYLLAFRGKAKASEGPEWNARLLASARERLQLWDLTDRQIADLERTGQRQTAVTVFSSADGIVVERSAVAGMHVTPAKRLYRIGKLDTMWVKADVYEHEVASVEADQAVTVTIPYLSDRRIRGSVDYIYPYLNPKTRTGTIRIKVANESGVLKPGMFVDVDFASPPKRRLLVPELAVMFAGEMRTVFVEAEKGRYQPREVSLGRRYGDRYEVLLGLEAGEWVVTSANFLLDSESKLKNVMRH